MLTQLSYVLALWFYAAAFVLYVAALVRGVPRGNYYARRCLIAAIVLQVLTLGWDFAMRPRLAIGVHISLALAAMLIAISYLVTVWKRPRLESLGGFVSPVVLMMYGASLLGSGSGEQSASFNNALLMLHVAVNILGVVAFVMAFAVSVAYLLQERLLKRKRIGGVFQRLPDLQVLEDLGLRLVSSALGLLTIGIVTGMVWSYRLQQALSMSESQAFALLAWFSFAAVLLLRWLAGWRGKRAAIGTIIGFTCSMLVLAGYLWRAQGMGP